MIKSLCDNFYNEDGFKTALTAGERASVGNIYNGMIEWTFGFD
jgi:hypothetical protein